MLSEIYFSVPFSWHTTSLLQYGRHTVASFRTDSEPKPSTTQHHPPAGVVAVHCGSYRPFWPMNERWLYLFPLKTEAIFLWLFVVFFGRLWKRFYFCYFVVFFVVSVRVLLVAYSGIWCLCIQHITSSVCKDSWRIYKNKFTTRQTHRNTNEYRTRLFLFHAWAPTDTQ